MIGTILASHGEMASGMLDSLKLFFGDLDKVSALCIHGEDDPAKFGERIAETIQKMDDGSGVMIFVDVLGGTPSNQAALCLRDENIRKNTRIITGMNLGMVMEFLGERMAYEKIDQIDLDYLMDAGREGVKCINKEMNLL